MQFTDIAAVQITTEPMYSIKGSVFYNFNFSRLWKFCEILLDINQSGHKRCRHRLDMGGQTSPPGSQCFSEIFSPSRIKLTNNNLKKDS